MGMSCVLMELRVIVQTDTCYIAYYVHCCFSFSLPTQVCDPVLGDNGAMVSI